jgi:hypothetical protein
LDCTETPCAGTEAGNVAPIRPPPAPVVKPQREPSCDMAAAKLTDPPPEVYRALVAHPLNPPEPYEAYERYGPYGSYGSYKLRFPYGRGLTKDGAIVLFNSKEHPLFIWQPGAEKPERCDSRQVPALVAREYFCTNCAIPNMGRVTLWHALDTLLNAWLRGDRATAAVLERWLVGKFRIYQKVVQERKEILDELSRAKAEAERRTWDPSMT